MPKKYKTPKRAQRVIDMLKSGQTLCRGYRPRAVGHADQVLQWWFEPSGKPCGPGSADQALRTGQLVALDGGLFDDGNSQTYGLSS